VARLDGTIRGGGRLRIFYIVKSAVTSPDAWSGQANFGDVEWQFSDGLSGDRSMSLDFLSLEVGMRELTTKFPGCTFSWDNLNV
jgi:hypothetical protein